MSELVHQFVAHTRLCQQEGGLCGIELQLGPQLCHVEPKVMCLIDVFSTPNIDQQLPVGDNLTGLTHQAR